MHICDGEYAFIYTSQKSVRQITPGDVGILITGLSDWELFTRKILGRNWIVHISLLKMFTSPSVSASKRIFDSFFFFFFPRMCESHRGCFCQFLSSAALGEFQKIQEKECFHLEPLAASLLPLPILFRAGIPTLVWTRPFRTLLWVSPLLFLFTLLCSSTFICKLNGNADKHRSILGSQNAHFSWVHPFSSVWTKSAYHLPIITLLWCLTGRCLPVKQGSNGQRMCLL